MANYEMTDFQGALRTFEGAIDGRKSPYDDWVIKSDRLKSATADFLSCGATAMWRRAGRDLRAEDYGHGVANCMKGLALAPVGLALSPLTGSLAVLGCSPPYIHHERSSLGRLEDRVAGRQAMLADRLDRLARPAVLAKVLDPEDSLLLSDLDEAARNARAALPPLAAEIAQQPARIACSKHLKKRFREIEAAAHRLESVCTRTRTQLRQQGAWGAAGDGSPPAGAAGVHRAASSAPGVVITEPAERGEAWTLTDVSGASVVVHVAPKLVASHSPVLEGVVECAGERTLNVPHAEMARVAVDIMHGGGALPAAKQWPALFETLDFLGCRDLLAWWRNEISKLLAQDTLPDYIHGLAEVRTDDVVRLLARDVFAKLRKENIPLPPKIEAKLTGLLAPERMQVRSAPHGGRIFIEDKTAVSGGPPRVQITWWAPPATRRVRASPMFELGPVKASLEVTVSSWDAAFALRLHALPAAGTEIVWQPDSSSRLMPCTSLRIVGTANDLPLNLRFLATRQWDNRAANTFRQAVDASQSVRCKPAGQRQAAGRLDLDLEVSGLS